MAALTIGKLGMAARAEAERWIAVPRGAVGELGDWAIEPGMARVRAIAGRMIGTGARPVNAVGRLVEVGIGAEPWPGSLAEAEAERWTETAAADEAERWIETGAWVAGDEA